jgi:hypothetical protein
VAREVGMPRYAEWEQELRTAVYRGIVLADSDGSVGVAR